MNVSVCFVAEQRRLQEEIAPEWKEGALKNLASRKEFLHDKNYSMRFVYTPKHCYWRNQIEIWFGIINRRPLKWKSYISIQELEDSILQFIEQYNLIAKAINYTYKGVLLTV